MSKKSRQPQFAVGAMAPGILMYDSCCKNKKKKNRKEIKKWTSREIEFDKNASDLDKARVINETEKQIIESIYKQNLSGLIIKSIRFSFKPAIEYNHMNIHVIVILVYPAKVAPEPEGSPIKKPD